MSEPVHKLSKAEQLLNKIFGNGVQHFYSQKPTEKEVVQLWFCETETYKLDHGIKYMQVEDKNKVYGRIAQSLLTHYQALELSTPLKDEKLVVKNISDLMKKVDKLKSDVKHLDKDSYITEKQILFSVVFEVEKKDAKIPNSEVCLFCPSVFTSNLTENLTLFI